MNPEETTATIKEEPTTPSPSIVKKPIKRSLNGGKTIPPSIEIVDISSDEEESSDAPFEKSPRLDIPNKSVRAYTRNNSIKAYQAKMTAKKQPTIPDWITVNNSYVDYQGNAMSNHVLDDTIKQTYFIGTGLEGLNQFCVELNTPNTSLPQYDVPLLVTVQYYTTDPTIITCCGRTSSEFSLDMCIKTKFRQANCQHFFPSLEKVHCIEWSENLPNNDIQYVTISCTIFKFDSRRNMNESSYIIPLDKWFTTTKSNPHYTSFHALPPLTGFYLCKRVYTTLLPKAPLQKLLPYANELPFGVNLCVTPEYADYLRGDSSLNDFLDLTVLYYNPSGVLTYVKSDFQIYSEFINVTKDIIGFL